MKEDVKVSLMKTTKCLWRPKFITQDSCSLYRKENCTIQYSQMFNFEKFSKGKFLRKSKKTLFSHNCVKGSKKNKFDNKTTKKTFPSPNTALSTVLS